MWRILIIAVVIFSRLFELDISCFADGDLLFFARAKQRRQKKHAPVSVLFFAFANFYGQFVNLPLRGFGHDKLPLKSSRKRSGTEDGELKTKCKIL